MEISAVLKLIRSFSIAEPEELQTARKSVEKEQNNSENQKKGEILLKKANDLYAERKENEAFLEYYSASQMGNAEAIRMVGFCYHNGIGIEKDLKCAVEFYDKAASMRNAAAITNLGFCFYSGEGFKKNLKKAVELYEKAAAMGHAMALNNLAACYENGEGVEKDVNKAIQLYEKSAAKKNKIAVDNLERLKSSNCIIF